jgi:error-prone DNA polymerase
MSYVELHAASAFSFLEAASLPEALVERAAELGYPAIALLDRDGVHGIPRFHKAAVAAGIRAIVGAEVTINSRQPSADSGPRMEAGKHFSGQRIIQSAASPGISRPSTAIRYQLPADRFRLPLLVESAEGYRNLCRLLTRMHLRSPKGEGALALEEFDGQASGMVALVGREALRGGRHGVGGLLDRLVGIFGPSNVCVEVQRHFLRDEEADNEALVSLASAFHVPVVSTGGVRFAAPGDRPLYDVLTCIRHKTTLDAAGRKLSVNAERYLKPREEMANLFRDIPEAVANTEALADRLRYSMADLGYRFPDYPVPAGEDVGSFLRKLTEAGARERYRPYHDRARAQIARELDLIDKLKLSGYFLIVWDLVNFCRQQGILVQGRGSAANSAVCYSLGITAVDPVGMDLLFERFLSEERGEWPDIDLDLPSGDRRERVIQHVYEKYGPHGAAMTANVITYRGRSAAREVGKTLGIDPGQVDRLAKVMHRFGFLDEGEGMARHMDAAGLDPSQPRMRLFGELWQRIQDLPRHLGQHSGGMVICQGRLDGVVPLENASMPGRVVVQWDKDDCADMGIVKIDLLGLGMMAALQDSLQMINARRPRAEPPLGLWNMPPDDPDVYRMLQAADTIGVFQVESRAQMATLPRLKPERFYDLVVEVALIRPGPITGQMVHPYLNRRAGREPVVYPHPSLEPILARTLGVPLFQEQLLRVAMVAAGFTGGQAEELRRALGFKRSRERMKPIETKLRAGMARNGITGAAADQIVLSITSFALYGFPESHSASFALLVYASAYLKAHFPAAFYAALLDNQPMGFYNPATLVKDAQRHGVRFAPVDVQRSDWRCTIEEDGTVRLGLRYVAGLRAEIGQKIADSGQRTTVGGRVADQPSAGHGRQPSAVSRQPTADHGLRPSAVSRQPEGSCRFRSIEDLIAQTGVNREELSVLAEIGALHAFGYTRREALWQVERAVRATGELYAGTDESCELAILRSCELTDGAPVASAPAEGSTSHDRAIAISQDEICPLPEMSAADRIVADYEGTGLTIGPHPMALRREEMRLRGALRASDLARQRHGRRVRVAGAVITRQRPGTAKGFVFLTLEDETGIANIIVRPDLFAERKLTILQEPFLLVEGMLQNQDGVTSVRAERMEALGGRQVDVDSRDFY